jgi:hypothetical protein
VDVAEQGLCDPLFAPDGRGGFVPLDGHEHLSPRGVVRPVGRLGPEGVPRHQVFVPLLLAAAGLFVVDGGMKRDDHLGSLTTPPTNFNGFTPQGGAFEKMTSLAKQAVSEGSAATLEQAMASIAVSNPALYNDYLIEKGA